MFIHSFMIYYRDCSFSYKHFNNQYNIFTIGEEMERVYVAVGELRCKSLFLQQQHYKFN